MLFTSQRIICRGRWSSSRCACVAKYLHHPFLSSATVYTVRQTRSPRPRTCQAPRSPQASIKCTVKHSSHQVSVTHVSRPAGVSRQHPLYSLSPGSSASHHASTRQSQLVQVQATPTPLHCTIDHVPHPAFCPTLIRTPQRLHPSHASDDALPLLLPQHSTSQEPLGSVFRLAG